MYEYFDHTADIGVRVRAGTLERIFEEAGEALFGLLMADRSTVRSLTSVTLRLDEPERRFLLRDWLGALLEKFDAERFLMARCEVALDEAGLTGTAWGEPFDPARHRLEHEVKAITYHGLALDRLNGEWCAELILDI